MPAVAVEAREHFEATEAGQPDVEQAPGRTARPRPWPAPRDRRRPPLPRRTRPAGATTPSGARGHRRPRERVGARVSGGPWRGSRDQTDILDRFAGSRVRSGSQVHGFRRIVVSVQAMPSPPPAPGSRSLAERQLTVLYETARVLADSATYAEAVPRILGAVGDALGWEYGALWDVDARAGVLRCAATWSAAPAAFESFAAISLHRTFGPGEGLPGRVWASGTPAWIPDVLCDPNFPRAPMAARDGLRSALGFPIVVGNTMRGVMEFFSRQIQEPDAALLESVRGRRSSDGRLHEPQGGAGRPGSFLHAVARHAVHRSNRRLLHPREPAVDARDRLHRRRAAVTAVSGLRACRGSAVDPGGRRAPGGGRARGLVREPVSSARTARIAG